MDIPVYKGSYGSLAVTATYEPDAADVHIIVTMGSVPILDVRVTAADAEYLITPILNVLAPLARELGDECGKWFKKVAADIRPAAAEAVVFGTVRVPARLVGRLERHNKSTALTRAPEELPPAAPAAPGTSDSAKIMRDAAGTVPGIVPKTVGAP